MFAILQKRSFEEILPFGIGAGAFFGVVFGLTMAFTLRRDTKAVPFANRDEFMQRLGAAIAAMRYVPVTNAGDNRLYKPRFTAGVAAGIRVTFRGQQVVMVGPKAQLSRLLKGLAKADPAGR